MNDKRYLYSYRGSVTQRAPMSEEEVLKYIDSSVERFESDRTLFQILELVPVKVKTTRVLERVSE